MSKVKPCTTTADLRALAQLNGLDTCTMECKLIQDCPQFSRCSAVDCPLDLLQGHRGPEEEERCRATKLVRRRIIEEHRAAGLIFALKYDGLTYKETVKEKRSALGRARWEALPEAEKQARIARMPSKKKKEGVLVGDEDPTPSEVGVTPTAGG